MIIIPVQHADQGTMYVPAPCRGTVAKVLCVFDTNTVEVGDTVVVARGASAVNTVTATVTAGQAVETGTPDATNKGLVFDPKSSTAANGVMKITDTGAPGAKNLMIFFDDSAHIAEAASEA